jgi:hypothetical protein
MAQQIIDTGAAANDGTGEPLRDAFTAVNENFTEIYTAGPVGSNVVISGNTITVTGVNNNLVLRANGIGNIQANSTIMPSIDAVYDIGAPTQRVDTVYAQYFVGNGSGITGVTAAAAANISLGFSNVTVTAGGPVTIGIQNTSNVAVFGAANTTFKGHVLPAANVTYDLGSTTQAWNDLYLSGNTVYLNNATITSNATALTFTNQAGGTFVLSGTGQSGSNTISNGNSSVAIAVAAGNVVVAVNGTTRATFSTVGLSVVGNVTTNGYFLGNGALLSGLPETYSNANVSAFLPTYSGNIQANNITILTTSSTVGNVIGGNIVTAGLITATGNITGGNVLAPGAVIATLLTGGNLQVTGGISGSTVTAVANVTGGNINTAGVVTATGNVRGGNITTAGQMSATGNITTTGFFIGNFSGNVTGNIVVPGVNTQVLYNDFGNAGASAGLTFDATSNLVTMTGNANVGNLNTVG